MSSRPSVNAALALVLLGGSLSRAETSFQEELAATLDRWNDAAPDRLAAAVQVCERRLQRHPDDPELSVTLARLHLAQGNARSAFDRTQGKPKENDLRLKALRYLAAVRLGNEELRRTPVAEQARRTRELEDQLRAWEKDLRDAGSEETVTRAIDAEARAVRDLERLRDVGRAAPELAGRDLDGSPVRLADLEGKVVLVDFWSTKCPDYVAAIATTAKVWMELRGEGFEIVAVSLDKDRKTVEAFVAEHGASWRHLHDGLEWSSPWFKDWGLTGVPRRTLVDRKGKIRCVDPDPDRLRDVVREALRRSPR